MNQHVCPAQPGRGYRSLQIPTDLERRLHHTWETSEIIFFLISNMPTLQDLERMVHHTHDEIVMEIMVPGGACTTVRNLGLLLSYISKQNGDKCGPIRFACKALRMATLPVEKNIFGWCGQHSCQFLFSEILSEVATQVRLLPGSIANIRLCPWLVCFSTESTDVIFPIVNPKYQTCLIIVRAILKSVQAVLKVHGRSVNPPVRIFLSSLSTFKVFTQARSE